MIKDFKLSVELDQDAITEKAKEFALKAIQMELEEYYTSYNSPFRQAFKQELSTKKISCHFELPDVLQTLNDSILKEHADIVETFISTSVIDDVRSSLQLQPKKISFYTFLKGVMECDHNFYENDIDKYSVDVEDKSSETKEISIYFRDRKIETIIQSFDKGKTYKFCRKAYFDKNDSSLLSRINSYLISLSLSGTCITEFDVEDFYELFNN